MPVNHVVLWKLKPNTTQAQIDAAHKALLDMLPRMSFMSAISFGETFTKERAQGWTHCLVVTLDSKQHVQAYSEHPAHVEARDLHVRPILQEALAMDYEFGQAKL